MISNREKGLTQEFLLSLFDYNPETGLLTRKITTGKKSKKGQVINHVSKNGYVQTRFNGKLWMVHRLIWIIQTGTAPSKFIDHINRNRADNRWCNLREADRFLNAQNRESKGVCFDKQSGRYRAQLHRNGVRVINKLFDSKEEALNFFNKEKRRIDFGQ